MIIPALSTVTPARTVVDGVRLRLRPITRADVTDRYVAWLNDPEVRQYSEYQFTVHTRASVHGYVERILADPAFHFFAIEIRDTHDHIGNVKLGPVDSHHRRTSIGIIIGERTAWGRGYATEAIALLERYAFDILGLHKLTAGMYATNLGSLRVFQKCGFVEEGRRRSHCRYGDAWVDYIEVGKINGRTDG